MEVFHKIKFKLIIHELTTSDNNVTLNIIVAGGNLDITAHYLKSEEQLSEIQCAEGDSLGRNLKVEIW